MSDALFPTIHGLGYGKKWPKFATLHSLSASLRETSVQEAQYPLWVWKIPYNYLWDGRYGQDDFNTLLGFICARAGSFDSFLYKDPQDFTRTQQILGIGDGTNKIFQISRTLSGFTEPVDYCATIANVKDAGTPRVDYTLQQQGPAQITFTGAAPANTHAVTADITYYFRVRFDTDEQELEQMFHDIWAAREIALIRVKP